jgi:hypothetical protein
MRTWLHALGSLALIGCSFSAKSGGGATQDAGDDQVEPDAAPVIDAGTLVDSMVMPVCVGGSYEKVCVEPPAATLMLSTQTIDTTSSSLCKPFSATPSIPLCVIPAMAITIPQGSAVTVIGNRPLVLLSTSTITIDGLLDASSTPTRTGPAADNGPCLTGTGAGSAFQGGGGGGGSYGTAAANGGNSPSSFGGGAAAAPNLAGFTAGCRGGKGGNGLGDGGNGGHSGGAVLLLAAQTVTLGQDGTINASGAGGNSGRAGGGGGGGGGSGGTIVVDAPTVDLAGKCFANGGAGGGGANNGQARDGGQSTAPDRAAVGGDGARTGGDGGDGATSKAGPMSGSPGSPGTFPTGGSGGGGGGGGGLGLIKVFATTTDIDDKGLSPQPR